MDPLRLRRLHRSNRPLRPLPKHSGLRARPRNHHRQLSVPLFHQLVRHPTNTHPATSTLAAPSLKAAARDLHAFQTARGYRPIPLAYSAADTASPLLPLLTAQYLTCDDHSNGSSATIDLFGMNVFLACSASNWTSLHDQLASLTLPVPVVISEAGCRTSDAGDRDFKDVGTVLGMRDVFGGASVFEWEMRTGEGDSRYGIVEYGDDVAGRGDVKTLAQFGVLAGVFGSAASAAAATGTGSVVVGSRTAAVACPTKDVAGGWLVEGDAVLPSIEGLQIGTVTVRTTVTQGAGGQATGVVQVVGGGGGGGGLSTGAVAGIAVGCGMGLLLVATGIFVCLRRRRRERAAGGAAPKEQEGMDEPPPSYTYTYPEDKAELPEQSRMVAEMDASSPYRRSSSMLRWKRSRRSRRSAREDSPTVIEPTVAELPERRWRRTTQYELEENYLARMGVGAPPVPPVPAGPWQVSPMSPESTKYV